MAFTRTACCAETAAVLRKKKAQFVQVNPCLARFQRFLPGRHFQRSAYHLRIRTTTVTPFKYTVFDILHTCHYLYLYITDTNKPNCTTQGHKTCPLTFQLHIHHIVLDTQCTYNATLRRVRVTTAAAEKAVSVTYCVCW